MVKKIVIGVLLYLVFLLVLLPASVVVAVAPLPAGLKLGGVSGTLWQGQAQTVQIQERQLEQVRWKLQGFKLLGGALVADVTVGGPASAFKLTGELGWSLSGGRAANIKVDTNEGFLLGKTALPFGSRFEADISLLLTKFSQGEPWCDSLDGKLQIVRGGLKNQFGDFPLGDMELSLGCEQGQVQLTAVEDKNALGLVGILLLGADNRLVIDAKIRETEFQSDDMKKALIFLGRKDAQGYYSLAWQGQLPRR